MQPNDECKIERHPTYYYTQRSSSYNWSVPYWAKSHYSLFKNHQDSGDTSTLRGDNILRSGVFPKATENKYPGFLFQLFGRGGMSPP